VRRVGANQNTRCILARHVGFNTSVRVTVSPAGTEADRERT
jgi:hypothetical protein